MSYRRKLLRFCWTTKGAITLLAVTASALIAVVAGLYLIIIAGITIYTIWPAWMTLSWEPLRVFGIPWPCAILYGLLGAASAVLFAVVSYSYGADTFGTGCRRQITKCLGDPDGELELANHEEGKG